MEIEEAGIFCAILMAKKRENVERRRILKSLRDNSNPFLMAEGIFQHNFRLPKSLCLRLVDQLKVYDNQKTTLPFEIRFLSVLHFLANGSFQQCQANNFVTPLSESSMSRSINEICKLIVQKKGHYVCFPANQDDFTALKLGFYRNFGIKATIGAIDCTHIAIHSPSSRDDTNPLSLYMNRKGYYSINVEAICDHRLKFLSVNAKYPGSCHDSAIWATSSARATLVREHSPNVDSWLIGDQGYPLEPWLLIPFTDVSTCQEDKYNKLHKKARNVIERAFGVLKSRFRCISKDRVLYYSHEKAALITYACVILNNMMVDINFPLPDEEQILAEAYLGEVENAPSNYVPSNTFREGARIRSRYVNSL